MFLVNLEEKLTFLNNLPVIYNYLLKYCFNRINLIFCKNILVKEEKN